MRKISLSGQISEAEINSILPRASVSIESVLPQVQALIEEVRLEGSAALIRHAEKFDGVTPPSIRVSQAALDQALSSLAPELRGAIELAIERVEKVSRAGLPQGFSVDLGDGAVVSQRYQPVDSVGLYVPGGKAVYPSSVVMNAVAAQQAGVPRLVIASPAQSEFKGLPHPTILATAALLGLSEVYAIGGASAVAAMAIGVADIGLAPVRMVTGPGNIYVAAAKRQLRSVIGIDSEAGPTEILIIADATANALFIATDLISQAEHDENAAAILVSNSPELIAEVEQLLPDLIATTPNRARVEASLAGQQSALVLTDSLELAIAVADGYATEHLEIHTANPEVVAAQISNAGAIFIGDYSPVSLGDYLAGSNHVLPTGEQAKFGPGLGVHSFLRAQQIISYSASALEAVVTKLEIFSSAEGLDAHGHAARARFKREG